MNHMKMMNTSEFRDPKNKDEETLLVFGYQSKLYRDDDKARWINSGKNMIPWMGNQELMIDRYDVRGYLNDLSEFHLNQNKCSNHDLTAEEQEFENVLNSERFQALQTQTKETDEHDPYSAPVSSGQYSNVAYNYEEKSIDVPEKNVVGHGHDYRVPVGLEVPNNIVLPKSMKLHFIIEKTAKFIAEHGLQMEILMKTKQASNENFKFLSIDSQLNPYYKYVLGEIKSGNYVPKEKQDESISDSDNDGSESDDNYLHPSLLSKSKISDYKIPQNVFSDEQEKDSYSKLVANFRDKFADDIAKSEETVDHGRPAGSNGESSKISIKQEPPKVDISKLIPEPPSMIKMIIEKLADNVGQRGETFENSIKALNDQKFDFLINGHQYHPYYVKRKIYFLKKYQPTTCLDNKPKLKLKDSKQKSIAFSLSSKKEPNVKLKNNEYIQNHLSVENDGCDHCDQNDSCQPIETNSNNQSHVEEKRLQEQRKRKALEFLKMLKKENRFSPEAVPKTFGPNLPIENVKLSPTIRNVTSPVNSDKDEDEAKENDMDEILSKTSVEKNLIEESKNEKKFRLKRSPSPAFDITNSPPKRYRLKEKDKSRRSRSRSRSKSHKSSKRDSRSHRHHRSSRRRRSSSSSRSHSSRNSSDSPDRGHHHRSSRHHHHRRHK